MWWKKLVENMQPLAENTVNVPAFLGKLWKMVNDPSTDHLICWGKAGKSFIIQNQAQFWYELLPLYYKHNNMSSFVRQLNMYGFHKMSTVENGTMDPDKDEIQFYHMYFQKDQPELLKNIKRKVTGSKSSDNTTNGLLKPDDLTKVLTDVKQLRGRQNNVDSQLSAMKQENAVLWRELALLRQKHIKQQQIVNKLIQFLVTLVRPSASARMGVGVKRRMPLMLHESPSKKQKNRKANMNNGTQDNGPTIHELDTEIDINPEQLLEEAEPMINSPLTPTTSSGSTQRDISSPQSTTGIVDEASCDSYLLDKPEYVQLTDMFSDDENLMMLQGDTNNTVPNDKVFLNPNNRDTLISNLVNGNYNSTVTNGKNDSPVLNPAGYSNGIGNGNGNGNGNGHISNTNGSKKTMKNDGMPAAKITNGETSSPQMVNDMVVATREPSPNIRINTGTLGTNGCYREDLDLHLEATQTELDQLKDILNGCNSFDANALLGVSCNQQLFSLFNDDAPEYGLSLNQNTDIATDNADPLVSGSEVATIDDNNLIDFHELFDDSLDHQDVVSTTDTLPPPTTDSTLSTPVVIKDEPKFN